MSKSQNNILVDIWTSLIALPRWVQLWVLVWLMPVNMASYFFLDQPSGDWIAILAWLGMLLNIPVLIYDRGFSKLTSVPHLLPWTLLVALILFRRPEAVGYYDTYLNVLLVTNIISLIFDYIDSIKWFKGDRAVHRSNPKL